MNQAILMDANVHKCAEIRYIANGTLELHARHKICHVHHIFAEQRLRQLVTGVTTRFVQLCHNVLQRRNADSQGLRKSLIPFRFCEGCNLPGCLCRGQLQVLQQFLGCRIAFRMNAGVFDGILAIRHTKEAGALFKGLRSQLGHLLSCAREVNAPFSSR